jgi:hypothetical protein
MTEWLKKFKDLRALVANDGVAAFNFWFGCGHFVLKTKAMVL